MEEYMLIFRHEDGHKLASPEQIQQWMEETMAWLNAIAARDKLVSHGNGLAFDGSKVVTSREVMNGPFGEVKERIGGYVLVRADNLEEAVEFAKGSPVLQGEGNSVEVRRLAHYKPEITD